MADPLQRLSDSVERAWHPIAEGWRERISRSRDALTRYTRSHGSFTLMERSYGRFERVFPLPKLKPGGGRLQIS